MTWPSDGLDVFGRHRITGDSDRGGDARGPKGEVQLARLIDLQIESLDSTG